MQIGGHARSEGLILVTDNMREFARMPGLRVENWALTQKAETTNACFAHLAINDVGEASLLLTVCHE